MIGPDDLDFSQLDFGAPDEEPSGNLDFSALDFSSASDAPTDDSPKIEERSGLNFDHLINQLRPITDKPADTFNWFMGQAAQTGRRLGYLQREGSEMVGQAAKNLLPGDIGDEAIDAWAHVQSSMGGALESQSKESSAHWLDQVSDEFKRKANAGLADPEFGVTTLYAAALGSLPEMLLTMGSGVAAGKLTQMAGTVGISRIAAAAEAGSPLASKLLKYSKYAPAVAGAAAGGTTEGMFAAGATGVAMEDRVNAMTHEELMEGSDRYRDVYDSAIGMSPDARRAYAKRTVAEELGRTTAAWVGLSTAALGAPTGAAMGYLGGRAAGAASLGGVVKKLEGTVAGQAATGFAGEGAQEFLQEGSQQFLQNLGIAGYADKNQSLTEGVADNAIIGGLVGGLMGGAITPLAGRGARAEAKGKAKAEADAAGNLPEGEFKFSRNPQLEAKITEQLNALQTGQIEAGEFQKVARWAKDRSAIEFSKALEQLLETGSAPDNVAAVTGDDFDEHGMLTEAAYTKDAEKFDFAVEMRIKPADDAQRADVLEALAADGANPYVMGDGTLVVPQSAPGASALQAVAESIQRRTGATVEVKSRENSEAAVAARAEVTEESQPTEADLPAAPEGLLNPEQREIERSFASMIAANPSKAAEDYAKLPDSEGGRILNTDVARELSPAYAADRTQSAAVHEPASALIKRMYAEKLAQPTPEGYEPVVLFSAGGTGAGKTVGLSKLGEEANKAEIIYDTNMNGTASAKKKIDAALESGRKVKIVYTYRDPIEAFTHGMLARAQRMENEKGTGRTVPLEEHVRTHAGSQETVMELAEAYKDNPNVEIVAIDNSAGKGQAKVVPLDAVRKVDQNAVGARLREVLDEEYQSGRISDAVYRGVGGLGTVDRGQLESQRAERAPEGTGRTDGGEEVAGGREGTDAAPEVAVAPTRKQVTVSDEAALEEMGRNAATHPDNDLAEPSERQLAAGNYPKGKGVLKGTDAREDIKVSVENVPGSIRRGKGWSRKMKHWYGYVRGTPHIGDGQLDVYMSKDAHDNTLPVFVIHQNNTDGSFDEPKVMLGYASEGAAKSAYLSEYPAHLGPKLFGGITRLSRAQFADYVESQQTDVPPNPMSKQPMLSLRKTDKPAEYTIEPYRYAKDSVVMKPVSDGSGWKTRASRLADAMKGRWSHRAGGYVMSQSKADKFKVLYENGWDGNAFTGELLDPDGTKATAPKVSTKGKGKVEAGTAETASRPRKPGLLSLRSYPLAPPGTRYAETEIEPTMMTPDAFLLQARPLEIDDASRDNIDDLKYMMQEGRQLDPLHLYADGTEDGRHRAIAAKELGIKKVPVIDHRMTQLSVVATPNTQRAGNAEEAQSIVDDIKGKLKGAPDIFVHSAETNLPTHLHDEILEYGAQGMVEGIFDPYTHHVHIIAKNVQLREGETFRDAIERIVAEETLGHYGLHAVFGEAEMNRLMDQVWDDAKLTPRMKAIIRDYGDAYGETTDRDVQRRMANEYLSKLDPNKRPTLWEKAVAWLREALRKAGFVRHWNDTDLKVLMDRVFESVRTGQVPASLTKLSKAVLSQDGLVTTVTVPDGDGKRSTEYDRDIRRITANKYRATLVDGMEGGKSAADVSSFSGDLKDFAKFVAEEGKEVIVAPSSVITAGMIARTNFDYRYDEGAHIIEIPRELVRASRKQTASQFSMRNREKGNPDVEAILAKTLQQHTGELSWGQKFNQWFKELTGYYGNKETYLELKTGWIDSAAAIERLERGQFDGKLLDASESAYKMVSLTKNIPQLMAAVAKAGVPVYKDGTFVRADGRKGLYDIFSPLFNTPNGKNLLHLWEGYAVARRSSQLIDQTNPDGTSKEKLLNRQEIDTLLSLEREYPEFRKVFDEWQTFNKQLLELAVDRGALSRDMADLWMQNDYVPFYRVDEEEDVAAGMTRKRGLSGQKVTSKRLTGSDKRIQPVLENIMLNSASILEKVYKNEAMNRIVALADGVAMTQEPLRAEAVKVSNEDIARAMKKAGLFVGDDSNSTPLQRKAGKLLRDNDIDYAVRAVENMTPEQREKWTTLFRRVRPDGPDVVSVMVAGKPVYYRVHDPLLLRAIMDMTPTTFGGLVELMGGAKRLLTNMVTLDPGFMAANLMRDTLSSWVTVGGEDLRVFRDAPASAAEVWKESGLAVDLALAGGMTGGFYNPTQDFADVMQEVSDPGVTVLNSPKKLLHAYRKVGMVSEQVNRMSIAKAVLRRGGSLAEAAYQAQDVLNFNQSGDAVACQLLIRTVPFLNARIQGLYRLWKGARGLDGRDPKKARMAFFMRGVILGMLSLFQALRNMHDERYNQLPEFQKDTYWHFFVGDQHYAIPKPFEVGVLFATLPERAARLGMGKDTGKTTWQSIERALGSTLAFNPVPQAFKPIVEQWANRSFFTDRPIVGMELEGLEPQAQYNPWTSETARAAAGMIDAVVPDAMQRFVPDTLRSPVRLEAAVRAYLGTLGGYALQLSDASLRETGFFPEAPAMGSVRDIPAVGGAVGRFVRGDPELESTKYADDLYDALAKADDAYRTLNAYINQGNLGAAEELTGRRMNELSVRPILHDFQEAARTINSQQRLIMNSDLTPEEKREQLDELTRAKNQLMKESVPYLAMMGY